MTRYDAVVVGGGPAGTATSALLAAGGVKVLLLDAGRAGRKVGEFIHPSVKAFVDRLGILEPDWQAAHLPAHGFVNGWATAERTESDFMFSPHGHGLCLNREIFETQLMGSARHRGVDTRSGTVVTAVDQLPGQRWSVTYRSEGAHWTAESSTLVLATGRGGRSLTSDIERVRFDRLAWLAARIPAALPDLRPIIESFPWGWAYTTPLRGDCSVVYLFFDARLGPPCLRSLTSLQAALALSDRLGAWVTSLAMQQDVPLEWSAGTAHSALARATRMAGRYLVGDLAEARDPLTTSGIHFALQDAARLCAMLLSERSTAEAANLAAERERSFNEYLNARRSYYRMEVRWPSSPFWAGEGASV